MFIYINTMELPKKFYPQIVPPEDEKELQRVYDYVQELRKLQEEADLQAVKQFYTKMANLRIKLKQHTAIPESAYAEMESLKSELSKKSENDDEKYAAFITVNPAASTIKDFDALRVKVERCVSKRWVKKYQYCYEQRSSDPENIHGLHAHILIRREIKPSHTEREIRSTFAKLVGDPKRHIHISWKKLAWVDDKLEYMNGHKTGVASDDVKKSEKTPVDDEMRRRLGIQKTYGNWNE